MKLFITENSSLMPLCKSLHKGTLHMRWDSGRTLGVCLEEDRVQKIPLEAEMTLLNTMSALGGDEVSFEENAKQVNTLLETIDGFAEEQEGAWVIKSIFLDAWHSSREPRFAFLEGKSIDGILQASDVKNGVDIGYTHARPDGEKSIVIGTYGANYTSINGAGTVTQAHECRLVAPAVARDFQERVDGGMDPNGREAGLLFNSPKDHVSLMPCINKCREIIALANKDKGVER